MTQLNSYAIMFEKPDQNFLKLNPVKHLGIFCFEPENLKLESTTALEMSTKYFEIKRNDDLYLKFITDMIDFLEGDIPNLNNDCSLCKLKLQTFQSESAARSVGKFFVLKLSKTFSVLDICFFILF